MSLYTVLNHKESIEAHYFPNERIPNGCRAGNEVLIYPGNDCSTNQLIKYCKLVWEWEAFWWNRSRFIFKHCCIPNY